MVYFKSQLIKDIDNYKISNINYYLTMGLFATPIIGTLVDKIYHSKTNSFFGSFGEDIVKNSFIALINASLTNIIMRTIYKKQRKNKSFSYEVRIFFQFCLYNYIFNLTTSDNGFIF
jgi:hypothetical protein